MSIRNLAGKTPTAYKASAVSLAAGGAIIAAAMAAVPNTATAAGGEDTPPVAEQQAAALVVSGCDGGEQKATWNRGYSGFLQSTDASSTTLPGDPVRIRGPQTGRDVVSVNLSAGSYLDSGAQGTIKVLLDGVPMAPSDVSTGSTFYPEGYGTVARNYCRKIGDGSHRLRVVFSANDFGAAGTSSFYLQDPMVHVEQSK
ncbi:MAG: hypothetical protein H0V49_04570 [Nocardioidaceae bacterium]|nr:hypothetical protein [Nocardioidaceae bacterium]